MSPLLIWHLIIFSVFNIATVVSDGASGGESSRMVKGHLAKRGEYKYIVYVSEKMPEDPGSHFSAFLISKTFVMADVSPLALKHAGKAELEKITYEIEADKLLSDSKGEQVAQATGKDIKIHPSILDPKECEFKEEGKLCYECPKKLSAMIIKVDKPFSFSEFVGLIPILIDCVPVDIEHPHSLIVGYGAFKPSGSSSTSNALGSVPGIVGGEQVCKGLHPTESMTWKSNICFKGNNPQTCDSDISGLLMHSTSFEDVAYGVITAGTCSTGKFLVGTGFGAMEKWVRYVTGNSSDIAYRTWEDMIRQDATTVTGGTPTGPTGPTGRPPTGGTGTPTGDITSPTDGTPTGETTPTGIWNETTGTDWTEGTPTGWTGTQTSDWSPGPPGTWTHPTGTDETPHTTYTEPTHGGSSPPWTTWPTPPSTVCPPCPMCPKPRGDTEKKSTGTKQSLFQFKFVIILIYFLL